MHFDAPQPLSHSCSTQIGETTDNVAQASIRELSIHQYKIDLEPALPVASQRINQRLGLIISATFDNCAPEFVEIAPLSGVDIQGEPLTGFSPESLSQVIEYLEQQLPSLIGQPIKALNELANQAPFASIGLGLSLLGFKSSSQFQYAHVDERKVGLFYYKDDTSIETLTQQVNALPIGTYAIKVKVAQASIEQEIAFIHQILAINPKLKLRLDANQGFSVEQAIEFLACLPKQAIEYIEEPCKTPEQSQLVYQSLHIPFALDETLNDGHYQFEMLEGLAALIIKPMVLGNIDKLVQLINLATSHGVRCILSSSLEANLGIGDLAKLAAVLTPDEIPGLDTLASFTQPLMNSDNQLNLEVCQLLQHYQG